MIERLVDEVARAVGREPNEVRVLNLVRPEQMPFTTIGGMRLDSGNYRGRACGCAPSCWTCRRSARGSSRASRMAG